MSCPGSARGNETGQMNITFLGTNGWFDTSTGNTICTLVRSKQCNIIFDAGNGIHKIDKYIDYSKDTFLFLSHFHLDHIIGLHMLNKFKFKKRFVILGQKGTKRILNKLIAPPFTISFPSLKYDVEFIELGEGKHAIPLDVVAVFDVGQKHLPVLGQIRPIVVQLLMKATREIERRVADFAPHRAKGGLGLWM